MPTYASCPHSAAGGRASWLLFSSSRTLCLVCALCQACGSVRCDTSNRKRWDGWVDGWVPWAVVARWIVETTDALRCGSAGTVVVGGGCPRAFPLWGRKRPSIPPPNQPIQYTRALCCAMRLFAFELCLGMLDCI